jgi:small GTP-binding protein
MQATIKIVLFGAGSVGKSAVAIRFVQGAFVDKYDPTIEDLYRKIISVDDHNFMLEIMDTAGTESFLAMRDLYIKNAQGFILLYSVISRSTFTELEAIKTQILHVKDYVDASQIPLVLAGNKCDLEGMREVSFEEGEKLAESWGNCVFMETSAKSVINIEEMFEEVTRQVLRKIPSKESDLVGKKKKKTKCIIL